MGDTSRHPRRAIKRRNRLVPAAAAFALILGLASVPGIAFAEEAEQEDAAAVVETAAAADPAPQKAEPAPEPEPVKEEPAAKPASEPQPKPDPEPSKAPVKEVKTDETKAEPSVEPVKATAKSESAEKSKSYTPKPAGKDVTCTIAWLQPGRALVNGDHINIDVVINGVKQQRNAYVDRNIPGGYDTLGLVINTGSSQVKIPLSEEEVKTGRLYLEYSKYISAEFYVVEWVQFNSWYFNQDRNPSKFLECGEKPPVTKTETVKVPDKWGEWQAKCEAEKWIKTREVKIYEVTYRKQQGQWVEVSRVLTDTKTETKKKAFGPGDKEKYCYTTPVPEASTFLQHTCEVPGTYTIPSTEDGVVYMVTTDQAGGAKVRKYPGTYYASADGTATGTPVLLTVTVEAWDPNNPAGATLLDSWSFTYTDPGDCTVKVTVTPPTFTPGACQAPGTTDAVETEAYKWITSGPNNAKVYTAVAKPGFTLEGQTVFGPYDLTQTSWKDPACQPKFQVVKKCTPEGAYVKITYTNNSRWPRWPDYSIGDQEPSGSYPHGDYFTTTRVEPGETKVILERTFDEDEYGGSVVVSYADILGAERDIDTARQFLTVNTDCAPSVVMPVLPETTPQVCTPPSGELTNGKIVLPETTGVEYSVWKGDVQVTNLDNVEPGEYLVKARVTAEWLVFGPADGWKLSKDKLTVTAKVVVEAAEDCTVTPPPPNPDVETYISESWKCYDLDATQIWSRTSFVPAWIDGKWVQVAQPPVEFTKNRPLTEQEIIDNCLPEKETEVDEGDWYGEYQCNDKYVTEYRVVTTLVTEYELVWLEDGTYVFEPRLTSSYAEESRTRKLTAEEFEACPVDKPEKELAHTGASDATGLYGVVALLTIGVGTALTRLRRR